MKRHIKLCWWLPAVAVMVVIFCFSQMNGEASSGLSGGIVESFLSFLERTGILQTAGNGQLREMLEIMIRKLAHGSEYALLGGCLVLPVAFHLQKRGRVLALLAIGLSALYACSDELHQLFISDRSGRLFDIGIDTAGACVGVLVTMFILRKNL